MDKETKSRFTRTMFSLIDIEWGAPYGLNRLNEGYDNVEHCAELPTELTTPLYHREELNKSEIEQELFDMVQDIYGHYIKSCKYAVIADV